MKKNNFPVLRSIAKYLRLSVRDIKGVLVKLEQLSSLV